MSDSRSALNFLQRMGMSQIVPSPAPQQEPDAHGVHALPLARPLPLPEHTQSIAQGSPAPDRGATSPWPWKNDD